MARIKHFIGTLICLVGLAGCFTDDSSSSSRHSNSDDSASQTVTSLLITADATSITSLNQTVTFTVTALDERNIVVPDAAIAFTADEGSLTSTAVVDTSEDDTSDEASSDEATDADTATDTIGEDSTTGTISGTADSLGRLTARFSTTDYSSRTIVFSATSGTVSREFRLSIDVIARLELLASNTTLDSSGAAPVTITVRVRDGSNRLIEGVSVSLMASGGLLSVESTTTDSNGSVSAKLLPSGPSNEMIVVSATVGELSEQVEVNVAGTTLGISATTKGMQNDVIPVVIKLLDSANDPISSQALTVSSSLGNAIDKSTLFTDAAGQATVTLTALIAGNEIVTVTALNGSVSATAAITISEIASIELPEIASLELLTSNTILGSSGANPVSITVKARDESNNLIAGVSVSLTSSGGILSVNNTTTDSNGSVSATLLPSGPANETIVVIATAGDLSEQVLVNVTGTTLSVSASPASMLDDVIPVVIKLLDSANDPLSGEALTVSSSLGNTIDKTIQFTDAAGQATVYLTASIAGNEIVTVTALNGNVSTTAAITISEITSLELLVSNTTLGSSGADPVTITAIVRDEFNRLIKDASVLLTSSSGVLTVNGTTTDSNGSISATLLPSGPSDETIVVTAVVNELSEQVSVSVVGTTLTITATSAGVVDDVIPLVIKLLDSDSNPISGVTLNISSSLGNAIDNSTPSTNASGQVTANLTASIAGDEVVTVTALNGDFSATAAITISEDVFRLVQLDSSDQITTSDILVNASTKLRFSWLDESGSPQVNKTITFATTRGTFVTSGLSIIEVVTGVGGTVDTNVISTTAGSATINALSDDGNTSTNLSVTFTSDDPETVSVSATPSILSSGETSTIRATLKDVSNNPVSKQLVNFSVVDAGGGTLAPGLATTDSNGVAQTTYTAGGATPIDGVVITATAVKDPTESGITNLTVTEKQLTVSFGTGNSLRSDETTYSKDYEIFVNTLDGLAVEGVQVEVLALPYEYNKGVRSRVYEQTLQSDGITIISVFSFWDTVESTTPPCSSEDIDRNGRLDEYETDTNGDGVLTPGGVATINTPALTNSEGRTTLTISYPKNKANWATLELSARVVSSAGASSTASEVIPLPIAAEDTSDEDITPPGVTSPYGTSSACDDAL